VVVRNHLVIFGKSNSQCLAHTQLQIELYKIVVDYKKKKSLPPNKIVLAFLSLYHPAGSF
jgi:hypothetical protein